MQEFRVRITGPNGWEVTEEEMISVLEDGMGMEFGWRCFDRGARFEVVEVTK